MSQEMRYNLATKVMRNGVEVIVATDRNLRPVEPEYLRHLSSTVIRPITLAPHTLTNLMSMVLPTDQTDDEQIQVNSIKSVLQPSFVTKTYYTAYNYPATVVKYNTTKITNFQTVISNEKVEEYSSSKPSEGTTTQSITLNSSPTLQTEVMYTTYTYQNTFLDGEQPIVVSSTHTLANTLIGDFEINQLEPSEIFPTTNTYIKTIDFTKTLTDGTDFQVISTNDLVTQVVVTDRQNKKSTNAPITTDVTKTYFVTYTYFSTYIDGDKTKVKSDVSVSSDVTIEKFYIKPKKTQTRIVEKTEEMTVKSIATFPFNILATKTFLTTFTYFTTLLHGPNSDKAETKINSRTKVVENTITQTISLQELNPDYLIRLNSSLNKITGSLVATATLKKGEKIRITAHKNSNLNSSYVKYEIKPTKTTMDTTVTESVQGMEVNTKVAQSYSKSTPALSKIKNTAFQKVKIKPIKTAILEATAEALVAAENKVNFISFTPSVTLTATGSEINVSSNNPDPDAVASSSVPASLPEEAVQEQEQEQKMKNQDEQLFGNEELDPSKKKPPVKQPNASMNVSSLLNLNTLGINGMNVLGPVFNAMAELIHNNLNKNVDSPSRRNDSMSATKETEIVSKKPTSNNINPLLNFVNKFTPATTSKGISESKSKVTTPRMPVYIPVGSFAKDTEFSESQISEVIANKPENWHEKWRDSHGKNFEKGRPHDPPITILEGGIPISPGQVITTNSDVIIGRPGETGPQPPVFAVTNNVPIDMKPPPLPQHIAFKEDEKDEFLGQHSTNQGNDLIVNHDELNLSRPSLSPPKKHSHEPYKNLRPHSNDRYKGSSHHKNPHNGKHSNYDSGTVDLNPPPRPPPPVRSHDVHKPITINHEQEDDSKSHKSSLNHIIPFPSHLSSTQNVENYLNPAELNSGVFNLPTIQILGNLPQENVQIFNKPTPAINTNPNGVLVVPTVAHISLNLIATENSHLVDRSTGQQLLVNIQPSQVANIVIPHGSSTALILSDGKQHSLKGEVIDDPSPHPEPETVGFIGAEPVLKIENDDISTAALNDVIPAEAAEVVRQSSQDNQLVFPNRPHLTTELIKIRPKPQFNNIKGQQQHFLAHSNSEQNFHLSPSRPQQSDQFYSFNSGPSVNQEIRNHHPTDSNFNNADLQINQDYYSLRDIKGSGSKNQDVHEINFGSKPSKINVNQNYRKDGLNVQNGDANFLHFIKELPSVQNGKTPIRLIQNQQKNSFYLNSGGTIDDQDDFIQTPNPVKSGIYVDISPPGHLPPNINLLQQTLLANKQPSLQNEHLLNHQTGHVHDVPLNVQVQVGSGQKKGNPLKEILINSNKNQHDSVFSSQNLLKDGKFAENHIKRPLAELPENLSPPPLNKEENYRIHRPPTLKPLHPVTSIQRFPPHPYRPVPKPVEFMVPPPKISHRPNQKPHLEHPSRPIIPIGAGTSQQNYPNPRPEDILIIPPHHRPGGAEFNYVSNVNQNIHQQTQPFSDLDVSDTSGPLKTEYGEEIQESISRPLFPGQLPVELQQINSTPDSQFSNHKNTDASVNYQNTETGQTSKLNGSTTTKFDLQQENHEDVKHSLTNIKDDSELGKFEITKQSFGSSSNNHGEFFTSIKKPSKFVPSSDTETADSSNNHQSTSFTNHRETFGNHKEENSFDSQVSSGTKTDSGGTGKIRVRPLKPSVFSSGFVKTENSKKPSPSNDNNTQYLFSLYNQTNKLNISDTNKLASNDLSSFSWKGKPTKQTPDNQEHSKDKNFDATRIPPHFAENLHQNRLPERQGGSNFAFKGETSNNNEKFVITGFNKRPAVQEPESTSGTIKFDSNKILPGVFNPGVHSNKKPQRYPVTDLASSQSIKTNKRPTGFTTTKKEEKVTELNISTSVTGSTELDDQNNVVHSSGPGKISSSFTSVNETNHFDIRPNPYYDNKTKLFYELTPEFDFNEERDATYNKGEGNANHWFASNFGVNNDNTDKNKITPGPYRNSSSGQNTGHSDAHLSLLTPPKLSDGRPKPDDVMGLSPPPLERPRRPSIHRPKPPFKFEIPTTPKSTLSPIAIENDFPPVRSPDINRKPIKPQDIFPPRLPDNFIHHLPEFPLRNHQKNKPRPQERPVTSMPIDTPGSSSTEKDVYTVDKNQNSGRDTFFAGSDINGHSKPVTKPDQNLSSMRPPPSIPNDNWNKPVSNSKFSIKHQQPTKIRASEKIKSETSSVKQSILVPTEREEISPTKSLSSVVKTTFHTKVSTSVTPTAIQSQNEWQYSNIITGSETVFNPEKFSSYVTPAIHDFTSKKNIVTTLISTGSTTIFGDIYTLGSKKNSESSKPSATSKDKDDITEAVSTAKTSIIVTKTAFPIYTITSTVTTTMTTVVHSVGHKPSTKTIVLTKTLISTVFNKITETKTLVKPTTATVIQTHTIATTKTALVVPTALYPTPTKYGDGGTLKPEIFMADPHAKDTMTISVSSSMNKNKHGDETKKLKENSGKDSILVFMADKHPDMPDISFSSGDEENIDVISEEDNDINESKVVVGGVFEANKEKNYDVECTPGCKARRNELCQRIEGVMKCVCRPGFARMFPDRPCRPTYTYKVQLMLEKFGSEQITQEKHFVQSKSPNMAKLASATKEGLDRMIMQSDLRDIYHGVLLNGFQEKDKKTMVDFYVQLSENTDEAKLMQTLKKTLQTSNYSVGGTELFAAKESNGLYAEDFNECLNSQFHDCSENARCFNLKGTYTCSCKEGFTDLSENSQFRGRVCSDTIGCEFCGYHGACYSKVDQITCECFQWYSGERCHINLKVLLIALVTVGAILLALLLVCAVMTCINRSRSSTASRTNGSSAGYLRYRGPSTQSLDRRAMIGDSSSESSVDNLPYICPPPLPSEVKKKTVLRHTKGPAPRPVVPIEMEQRDRSVTVMIPRAKYRPMPPLSPLLTMSTFSPDKHLSKTAAQIATEQKLINYLDGNVREDRTLANSSQTMQAKEQQKVSEYKTPNIEGSPKAPEKKKETKVFEYEYKISNMLFTEETNSTDKRSFKSLDDRFRRHSDSTQLNSNVSSKNQFRKYSAGALVSAGYEVSAKVGMHQLEEDTTEDENSAILNTHTMKSSRSQFTTLNRTGDHKTMSEARSYDETTVHPSTRSLKTHYSNSSPSSRVNNDEGHTMIERDLGSTFIMPESQLFKPDADRGSDISNFDSL